MVILKTNRLFSRVFAKTLTMLFIVFRKRLLRMDSSALNSGILLRMGCSGPSVMSNGKPPSLVSLLKQSVLKKAYCISRYLRTVIHKKHDSRCCYHGNERLIFIQIFIHFWYVHGECEVVHLFWKVTFCFSNTFKESSIDNFTAIATISNDLLNDIC